MDTLRRLAPSREDDTGLSTEPPFAAHILVEPLPRHFKVPQLEVYDGTSDPLDHLQGFRTTMLLHRATDATLCRAFPSTLRKSARYWYSNLRPGSIQSFEQLSRSFVAHFASSRKPRKGSDSLIHIKQREGESLRSYMGRFNKAALEVYDLDHAVAMTAMKSGLQSGPFLFSLGKRSPTSFTELLTRAEKYARAEEACKPAPSAAIPRSVRPPGLPKSPTEPTDRSQKRKGRPLMRNAPPFHRPR